MEAKLSFVKTEDIRVLIESIQDRDESLQKGVFNIIKKYTNKFTENQNGVFVDMTKLDESALREIESYIQSNPKTKKELHDGGEEGGDASSTTTTLPFMPPPTKHSSSEKEAISLAESRDKTDATTMNLTEEEKAFCGLNYLSNRKKDLNLYKKKFT